MAHFRYIVALFGALGTYAIPRQNPTISSVHQLSPRTLPIGTCNSDTPCANGACCGSNSPCGYSPTECGTGCTSDCDAKAQCGQYGSPGQQNCPLNVCCSKFGSVYSPVHPSCLADYFARSFCGSTSDFCDDGCQTGFGGCGSPPQPFCGDFKAPQRTIGSVEIQVRRDG